LYAEIGNVWGTPPNPAYLFRGGHLRAQVSAGHAIALGYLMAIALGFWFYLRSRVPSTPLTKSIAIWLCAGLLAAYSRGPWVVAVVIFFAYLALGPNGPARLFKTSLISALLAGLVLISPVGGRVIANLPFIGTIDEENVTYRQQLAAMSWKLIQKNPFFGDLFFAEHLESLRQGQGIIDLMNGYAAIGLAYGLVGLSLLLGFFLVGMWKAYRVVRMSAGSDADISLLGVSLIACMLGTLIMMAVGGFGSSVEKMFYILAGVAAGYAQLGQLDGTDRAQQSVSATQSSGTLNRR
jgi:O-antigen ligase